MSNLSVLMVVAHYPATHGHNTVINNLCLHLKKVGIKVAVGAFSFTENPPNGIEKIILNKRKLLLDGIGHLKFDIIHSHQPRVNYYLLFKKPVKPVIFHYHGPSNWIHKFNFKLSMMLFGQRLSKIITVSQTALEQMNNLVGNFPSQVLYNGVDTELFNPNLPAKHRKGNPQLLFVGALRKYKKPDVLINAMPSLLEKYPDAFLQIVGSGQSYEQLKELVTKLKIVEHVELVGEIKDPSELALYYTSCDLYVSASLLEACPVPPFEAMSCGKPLMLSKINAHEEIISISNSGVVFDIDESASASKKIEETLQQKTVYGKNALHFAKNHDWEKTCEQLIHIYRELLTK